MHESEEISRLRAGFEDYYTNVLQPKFAGIEADRKKYLRYFIYGLLIIFVILPLICAGLFWIFLLQNNGKFYFDSDISGNVIFAALLVIILIISTPLRIFKKKAKSCVMPEFIKYFGDFEYRFEHCLPDELLQKSRLFSCYNRHSGDDFFSGSYKDVKITISEEELLFHTRSGKHSSTTTVFDGIVIQLAMNKDFSGQTIVLKDWGIFNTFHKLGNIGGNLQKISLEDCIFEKEFEVYGTDQLEARYLLTTAFMERILKVRDAFRGKKIQFSFFDNKLLIAIDISENMFESTSIFRCTTDRKLIDKTFEQFISVMEIIETLKLARS